LAAAARRLGDAGTRLAPRPTFEVPGDGAETTTLGPVTEPLGGLSFLFHNLVLLRYIELESEIRRALSVVKMRDSSHAKDLRQFEVDERGFTVLGKLEVDGNLGWSALRRTARESR
jgi:circadian clock protein KaiC